MGDTLFVLAVILLVLYVLVRAGARLLAGWGGTLGHQGYRLLAQKYRGKYENRGLVDPPTISFEHNGSSVRVGLAPVVPGRSAAPRTRVVARFPQGLPFRLELMPHGRPAPPQPPKGTRSVRTGHADFDRLYYVQANDPDIARSFFHAEAIRAAVENLRRLAPPTGVLVSINPERLLVQVDRNLGPNPALLDLAVREALALHDRLRASVDARITEGIAIVAAGPAPEDEAGPPTCDVCGDPITGLHVACVRCKTPSHRDCWTFVGGCSTFGCQSKQCVTQ